MTKMTGHGSMNFRGFSFGLLQGGLETTGPGFSLSKNPHPVSVDVTCVPW